MRAREIALDPDLEFSLRCRQLTSGTTGVSPISVSLSGGNFPKCSSPSLPAHQAPKAVALTSRNLLNNGIAIGDGLRFTSKDILCNVPPLFHCFGLVLGNLAAWVSRGLAVRSRTILYRGSFPSSFFLPHARARKTHGASVVYAAEGFDPVRALRATSEERCTALHGVPTHFISELEVLDQIQAHASSPSSVPLPPGARSGETFDFTPLRTGLTSGSTVPIELMHRIMDPRKLGAKEQTVVYGMTESSPVSFQCALDAPIDKRCETVGKVSAHTHAKIVAPEDRDGKPLPVGQPGEVCVAGYLVFQGGSS